MTMSEVSVDRSAIAKSEKLCKDARSVLKNTMTLLHNAATELSTQWNDQKFKEFESIIEQCRKSLNSPIKELERCGVYLSKLSSHLEEYERISFAGLNSRVNDSDSTLGSRNTFGGGGIGDFFMSLFGNNINDLLKNVEYIPLERVDGERTDQEIIESISGGDLTEGSCSSLALAYAGNRAGYNVHDFRDGRSRYTFSLRSTIEHIANMPGVVSFSEMGTDDALCAELLYNHMEHGREYFLASGHHAAIVRQNENGHYQYLELQSGQPGDNGWHMLTERALYERFGCVYNRRTESASYLIELNSLQSNSEFLNLLGYINTNEADQRKGENGHVR